MGLQVVGMFIGSSIDDVTYARAVKSLCIIKCGSNMTGTDLCVNKPHCAAAVRP